MKALLLSMPGSRAGYPEVVPAVTVPVLMQIEASGCYLNQVSADLAEEGRASGARSAAALPLPPACNTGGKIYEKGQASVLRWEES